jgi:hypothetical protein
MDQFHVKDLFPRSLQKIFEFNGALWTNAPAISTSSAQRYIMKNLPAFLAIIMHQGIRRTILLTGQTSVAFIVNPEY